MNNERELLRKILRDTQYINYECNDKIRNEIQELLAQPDTEQEPVVWQVIGIAGFMYLYNKPRDEVYEHHTVNALYASPQKPLTPRQGLEEYKTGYKRGFEDGHEECKQQIKNAFGVDDE